LQHDKASHHHSPRPRAQRGRRSRRQGHPDRGWPDPGDAAKALLDQGADVIMQHTDSPAAMQIASERGKLAFDQDSEMIKFGPKAQPYYIERVKAELDGTWKSEDFCGGLKAKTVVMAPYTNMPDDVKKRAEDTEAAITAGKLFPFKCPVIGRDGKEVESKGDGRLADGQVLGMNFYVKGIDDKIPGK
jgi:basic membrane protein A